MGHCQNIPISEIWQGKRGKNHEHRKTKTITKSIIVQDNQSFDQWVFCLKSMTKNAPLKLMFVPIQNEFPRNSSLLCGEDNMVELTYSEYSLTLQEKLKLDKKMKIKFPQNQIWYILYAVMKLSRYLERIGKQLINLTSAHILFNSLGEVKIINCLSSPLHFQMHKQSQIQQPIQPSACSNQLFNIMIMFLQITTHQQFNRGLLCKSNDAIFKNTIQEALKKTQKSYSPTLTEVLRKMANSDYKGSNKYSQIQKVVSSFETLILAREFRGDTSMRNSLISNPKTSGIFYSSNVFKNSQALPEDKKDQIPNRYTQHYQYNKVS